LSSSEKFLTKSKLFFTKLSLFNSQLFNISPLILVLIPSLVLYLCLSSSSQSKLLILLKVFSLIFSISLFVIFGFDRVFLISSYHVFTFSTLPSLFHKKETGWSKFHNSCNFSSEIINLSNKLSTLIFNKSGVFHNKLKYSIILLIFLISVSIIFICKI
jgi:hypothetical protein